MLDRQAEHSDEFHEMRLRLAAVERAVVALRGDMVGQAHVDANLQDQIDRLNSRMDRVERRLDIAG